MSLSLDYLSNEFLKRAYANPDFRDSLSIASQNSRGRIWLIGGFLYKSLINIVHGFDIPNKDFDFVVGGMRHRLSLPDGWTSRINRFGNPELNGTSQVDLVPLENIFYLRKKGLEPSISNYIHSVNLNIMAMAFDMKDEQIIDGGGLTALEKRVVAVHNKEMAEISAEIYGRRVSDMVEAKAQELHFKSEI